MNEAVSKQAKKMLKLLRNLNTPNVIIRHESRILVETITGEKSIINESSIHSPVSIQSACVR